MTKIEEQKPDTLTIPVTFKDQDFNVTFDPDFWTCKQEREYFDGDKRYSEKNIAVIVENVTSWGYKKKGVAVPLTQEALEATNVYVLQAVVSAMIDAIRPNSATT